MDQKKIMTVLRRAGLRLVSKPSQSLPIMERKRAKYAKSLKQSISYQTLPSNEDHARKAQESTSRNIIRHQRTGPGLAVPGPIVPHKAAAAERQDNEPVDIIGNAGVLHIPDEITVPNEYEFEILRLRRRVEELECTVKDRDERNVRAIAMLEDEAQMWRTLMHDHVSETHGGIQQRVIRIESTLLTLKEKGSRIYPPLVVTETWQKTKARE